VFAGNLRTERGKHVLLAMQKVEGSNPFSRFAKGRRASRPARWSSSSRCPSASRPPAAWPRRASRRPRSPTTWASTRPPCVATSAPVPAAAAGQRWCRVPSAACAARLSAGASAPGRAPRSLRRCVRGRRRSAPRRPPLSGTPARAAPKWEQERKRWPSAQLVRSRFGSWAAALRAAGYRSRWRGHTHTQDELITALRREADRLGRPPTQREWATGSQHRPNASTVARAFGSWAAGLRAAGLEPPPAGRWNDGEIVEALREWAARHHRPPLSSDWRHATPDHPSAALARRRFGSWRAALDAAGLAPPPTEWTRERVLDAIRTHIDRHGRPPLSSQWRRPDSDEIPPSHVVINRFGSWRAAIAASTARPTGTRSRRSRSAPEGR
jgi:hypothetical protein